MLPADIDRSTFRRAVIVWLPVVVFVALYSVYAPNVALINPDSEGYLSFGSGRTGGYPFFLAALKPFVRDAADYVLVQRLLFALAVALLGWQLLRLFDTAWLTVLIEVALLGNPSVNQFHFSIGTESLFLSLNAVFFAAAFAHLRAGGLGSLCVAAASAAFAAAVRPTGLALLPGLAILIASAPNLSRSRLWKALLAAAVPVILVGALESAYYYSHHPAPRESLAPQHLLGKAALVETADPAAVIAAAPPHLKPLQQAIEFSLAPVRRRIAEAPSEAARCRLTWIYEEMVQYESVASEKAIAIAGGGQNALAEAGLARLRGALPGYLRLSADNLVCLWTFSKINGTESAELLAHLESRQPLPFGADHGMSVVGSVDTSWSDRLRVGALRIAMVAVAALLLLPGIVLLGQLARLRQPGRLLAAAGLSGLIMHGGLLLTALTAVGVPRYTLGLWVPLVLGAGLSAIWMIGSAVPGASRRFAAMGTADAALRRPAE
jgi:hypothetical protein